MPRSPASADLVIGERLHAVVLATAVGTLFAAVEYRPKLRDFARSIGQERAVVRTDEIDRLDEVVLRLLADGGQTADQLGKAVSEMRTRQRATAEHVRSLLSG